MSEQPLHPLGHGVWFAEGPIVDFYHFPYPTRSVVVRLDGGELWIWSPIALTDALRSAVDALGSVAHLVSPNRIHHLWLEDWARAYPRAGLWGLPELRDKRPELAFTGTLGDEPPPAWAGQIDQVVFRGSVAMEEIAFFHRASCTAIFGDLIENFDEEWLEEHWSGWRSRLARAWGITAPDGMAPLEFRLSFLRRQAAREALRTVLGWPGGIDAVVMAHGQIVPSGGHAFVERSFGWLGGKPAT